MEGELVQKFLENITLLGFMGVALYVFYKKDETRRTNDLIERKEMRDKLEMQEQRLEKYLIEDKTVMQNLIRDYTDVTKRQSIVMEKANAVMACLVKEIQEFKKTTVYKMHEENKKNFDYEKHT